MTENELIDYLEDEINGLKEQKDGILICEIDGKERIHIFKEIIGIITEIEQYRKLGTVEEIKIAVDKQKPKKMKHIYRNMLIKECCPKCNSEIYYDKNSEVHYCKLCGQRLESE